MGYKFKRYADSVWFTHPSGGRFKIRGVPPKRFLEIMEGCKKGKQIIKDTDGEDRIVDDYNDGLRSWLVFCEMIDTWENIDDLPSDQKREETLEGFFNDKELRDWIADKSNELLTLHDKKLEGELKKLRDLAAWVISQRDKPYQYTCEECKEFLKQTGEWDGIGIPSNCQHCRPDIDASNSEIWDIYRKACMEGMGFSMMCADKLCDTFQVSDKQEALLKIEVLHSEIRKLESEQEKKKKSNLNIPGLME